MIDHRNVAMALYRLVDLALENEDDYGPLTLGGDVIGAVEVPAYTTEGAYIVVTALGSQKRYRVTVTGEESE